MQRIPAADEKYFCGELRDFAQPIMKLLVADVLPIEDFRFLNAIHCII